MSTINNCIQITKDLFHTNYYNVCDQTSTVVRVGTVDLARNIVLMLLTFIIVSAFAFAVSSIIVGLIKEKFR